MHVKRTKLPHIVEVSLRPPSITELFGGESNYFMGLNLFTLDQWTDYLDFRQSNVDSIFVWNGIQ